jgi:hypothetical protein
MVLVKDPQINAKMITWHVLVWLSSKHSSENGWFRTTQVIVPFLLFGSIQRKLIKETLNQVQRKPFRRLLTSQMEVLTPRNL